MRTPVVFVVTTLLFCACGAPMMADAGTPGGGGGAGGGSGGGGPVDAGEVDAGTDAGSTQDAGPVDAGPSETFRFRVVQGDGAFPVANVAIRIAGRRVGGRQAFVDGYSNGNGEVVMSLPGASQRPLDLTLTRLDHGVLSIIGLTTEFPTQVRLDPTSAPPPTEMISGSITGKTGTGRVVIDSYDFFTTSSTTPAYQSQYMRTSGHALPVVGMETAADNTLINWVVVDGGTRLGAKVVNLALPATPEVPASTPWSATFPDAGIITFLPANPFLAGWRIAAQPTESWIATGTGSATRDATGMSGNFTALTGPLAPNRLILELTDGSSYLQRHRHRDLTPPISFRLPQVNQISITGTRLGNLAAAAAANAADFDTLCVTVELPGASTVVWRVYTAPGAGFAVPGLPDLPEGLTPAGLSVASPGTMLNGLAYLIRFEDQAMRPWLLQNSTGPLDAYRDTFGGGYQTITGAWR